MLSVVGFHPLGTSDQFKSQRKEDQPVCSVTEQNPVGIEISFIVQVTWCMSRLWSRSFNYTFIMQNLSPSFHEHIQAATHLRNPCTHPYCYRGCRSCRFARMLQFLGNRACTLTMCLKGYPLGQVNLGTRLITVLWQDHQLQPDPNSFTVRPEWNPAGTSLWVATPTKKHSAREATRQQSCSHPSDAARSFNLGLFLFCSPSVSQLSDLIKQRLP